MMHSVCPAAFLLVLASWTVSVFSERMVFASSMSGLYRMNERFGVSNPYDSRHPLTDDDYRQLGHLGWYSDWEADSTGGLGPVRIDDRHTIKRIPLIAKDGLLSKEPTAASLYQSHPDWFEDNSVWQIGSRPGWDGYRMSPGNWNSVDVKGYADVYHICHDQIKDQNSTFKVMTGAVILGDLSQSNQPFLEQAIATYHQTYHEAMPVDVFNVQIFIPCNTADPQQFLANQITAFRKWMSHVPVGNSETFDYSGSELWITALGITGSSLDPTQASDVLRQSVQWLMGTNPGDNYSSTLGMPQDDHRLVQCWAWHALSDYSNPKYRSSNLFGRDLKINPLGETYAELIAQVNPEPASIFLMVGSFCFLSSRRRIRLGFRRRG